MSKYDDYLASPSWQERKKVFKALSPRCKGCGARGQLQIHHNNYDNVGNELPEDVCGLCPYCHAIFEFMRKNSLEFREWLENNYCIANAHSVSLEQTREWINKNKSSDAIPAGSYEAVLVAIVDLGTHKENYQGNVSERRKIYFCWELTRYGNRLIANVYTLSFHKKAKLRALIEGWRNKEFEDGESFDMAKLLGKSCMVNVVHVNGYAEVAGVSVSSKSDKPKNTPIVYEIEGDNFVDLYWLPLIYGKKIEDVITSSIEISRLGLASRLPSLS